MPSKVVSKRAQNISHKKIYQKTEAKAKSKPRKEKSFFKKIGISKKNLIIVSLVILVLASTAIYRMAGTGSYIKRRSEQLRAFSNINPQQFTYNGQSFSLGPDGKLVLTGDDLKLLDSINEESNQPEQVIEEYDAQVEQGLVDEPEIVDIQVE